MRDDEVTRQFMERISDWTADNITLTPPVGSMPELDLSAITTVRKSGAELFTSEAEPLGRSLLDFWQWGYSDLVKNTERAFIAEYLVAVALGVDKEVRAGWLPVDVTSRSGVTVEVKASAYVQSWFQKAYTKPKFDIKPKTAWDPHTDTFGKEVKRQADVYVFCLLHHRDQQTINPLDATQWTFYVLPTAVINQQSMTQGSAGLSQIIKWGAKEVPFNGIRAAVDGVKPNAE